MKTDALIVMVLTIGTVMSFTIYFFIKVLKKPEAASSSVPHEEGPVHPPSA
ncbi:MAG: hypothetical protein Kapaf2KO_15740 [Candidatus Kapaibacteriales bacterium]